MCFFPRKKSFMSLCCFMSLCFFAMHQLCVRAPFCIIILPIFYSLVNFSTEPTEVWKLALN